MKWLQVSNQSNVINLNSVICEGSRHFRNKTKEYLKAKIDELETNCKFKDIKRHVWASVILKGLPA
jgi:hypothetical protein